MYYNAPEDLLQRLATQPTDNDVAQFLWGQHDALRDNGQPSPPVSSFFVQGRDLAEYQQALAWWPKRSDLPVALGPPTLYQLCFRYEERLFGETFLLRLHERAQRVVKWLETNGHDVRNPDETVADRRRRQNREAQGRYRKRLAGTENAHDRAVADAYQHYMKVCAEKRAALDLWTEKVQQARIAWEALKQNPPAGGG